MALPLLAVADWLCSRMVYKCPSIVDARVVEAPVVDAPEALPHHALALDIVNSDAACTYYSSFDEHPVVVDASDSHVELQRTFSYSDGCTWRSFETLDRVQGSTQFTYTYREAPLACAYTARPAVACRRVGFANEVP
jgi:hypothetical protein